MAGPWEQYQKAPAAEAGPWTQYQSAPAPVATPAPTPVSSGGIPGARRAWSDVPSEALANVPASAGKFFGGLVEAVTSPVQTITNLGQLIGGAAYSALPQSAQDWLISNANDPAKVKQSIAMARAVGGEYAKRYGTEEGFKEALATDPVGVASDFSTLLTGGAMATAKAAPVASKVAATAAKYTNPLTPVVSAANYLAGAQSQPILNALSQAKTAAGESSAGLAAGLSGVISGKPGLAYKEAYKAGKAGDVSFLENLRGKVAPEEILTSVKQGIDTLRADTSAAYQTAKTGWAADKTPIDFAPIDAAYQKVRNSLSVGGKSKIGTAEQKIVDEIGTVLDEWRNDPAARTALDLDALKQRIDAIYPESPKQTQAQRAITEVRNAVKDTIVGQVQDYAQAMKAYETQQTLINDITKALGAGDKVAKETAINKVLKTLKDAPSAEFRRQLLDVLQQQGGINVMPAIAGQELAQWIPSSGVGRAIAGGGLTTAVALHHPGLAAMAPFTSPRLMGEAYYKMGRAAGAGRRGVNALANMTPEQIAYANALLGQMRNTQTEPQNQNALAR